MTAAALKVLAAGPAMGMQDMGRRGTLALGLSAGGAADRRALLDAGALLGQAPDLPALEMAAQGGTFEATAALRIALTGAPMAASIDGRPVAWHACHAMAAGAVLKLGGARAGVYGYLSVGGGFDAPRWLGSASVQPQMGLGQLIAAGDTLPLARDRGGPTGRALPVEDRFSGGTVRIVTGPQTGLFDPATRVRFAETAFRRARLGNRQGVALDHDDAPFAAEGGLTILSDTIVPGDVQMTGEGLPFVLLPDSQTTGGYPRIGTVVPDDLPLVAQAAPGAPLRFEFVDAAGALAAYRAARQADGALASRAYRLVRDPSEMADLLAYQLIGGVTAGQELDDAPAEAPA